jgi:hypothetical protein
VCHYVRQYCERRVCPPLLYGHLETSLATGPSLAILIHKDEDAGGNVTGPGTMAA